VQRRLASSRPLVAPPAPPVVAENRWPDSRR
jgi:hypothetical protein